MSKILDQVFIEAVQKKKEGKNAFFLVWKSSLFSLFHRIFSANRTYRISLLLGIISLLLGIATFVPSVFGVKMLYGIHQNKLEELDAAGDRIQQVNEQLLFTQQDIDTMDRLILPPLLNKARSTISLTGSSLETVMARMYRLIGEIIPRNTISHTLVLTSLLWDAHSHVITLEGEIAKNSVPLIDKSIETSGYNALAYFVINLNKSTYFQNSSIESVGEKEGDNNTLSFRIIIPLQKTGELDENDQSETFLDYLENKLQYRIKRQ